MDLSRFAAAWAALMTFGVAAVTFGLANGNAGWVPAWIGAATLHGLAAWGLWTRKDWGVSFAQGLALFGLGAFGQAALALGAWPSVLIGAGAYAILALLTLLGDNPMPQRQRWSLRLASMALLPAATFALAPEQTGAVMVATLLGAALVWVGTWGVARGRTWGVLAGVVGAPVMAISVAYAPSLAFFDASHFMVGQPLRPLMLDVMGGVAAAFAVFSVVPFAVPMARFLFRREA
ncbi:MAG: hypothetical protein AAGE52_14035 [Myxococcota bacterium]